MGEEKRKLIIGIPVYNDYNCFREMINSLRFSTDSYDMIYIIESNSTDGSAEFCKLLEIMHPNKVKVITTPKEGPLKAYNRLFKIALEENADLFLTQTDVIFPRLYKRDWLAEMRTLAQDETVGAVTCVNGGGVSGPDYLDSFRWLGGWCSYYPFRTIQKIGGYDENFPKGHYGVDIAHTYLIVKSGLNILYINYWCDHHQANTRVHDNDPQSEFNKKECAKYFREKYLGEKSE